MTHARARLWLGITGVGGWAGLPGAERLVLPARWLRSLAPDALALQVARRAAALESGSRTRGLLLALAFNPAGFGLAALAPGAGVTTVAGLVTAALAFTLWSFLGLLVLPTPSWLGVYEADLRAARIGFAPELFQATIARLDAEQDDEPERPPGVEAIFHTVPSVTYRVARLQEPGPAARGAWQAARQALYLSWAGWSFLPRAVHCNSGRPSLWVLYPGD